MSKWYKSITFNCDCEECNYRGDKIYPLSFLGAIVQ